MLLSRLNRLIQELKQAGLDAIALNPGPTLNYLTGIPFHLMERPVVFLIAPPHEPLLILPMLEARKLEHTPYPIQGITYSDNPATWQGAFIKAANTLGLNGKTIGIEPTWLRYLELNYLQIAMPNAIFKSAETVIASLRIQKDSQELACMRRAVLIAQEALHAALPVIRPGATERQIAGELTAQLFKGGADGNMGFAPIVSSGPNSANPHATPSDRELQPGDLLVIDWGAAVEGYYSDLTRTFAIGEIDPEYRHIAEVVKLANQAGRAAGKPGLLSGAVDNAAREVIQAAGYGEYFTHRTGHGLGLEVHEPPYMFAENTLVLAPGMTYTVEPGIYLPGRGGVRIEDNVVITESGCETLSDLPRDLIQI